MSTALLVIDMQVGFIEGDMTVHDGHTILERVKSLIQRARASDILVVFVQHNSDPEIDGPIHAEITPLDNETIILKMTPDSFHLTSLQNVLNDHNIKHLIIAGFQTEMCIDTTARRAVELGYQVTVVSDAHSTFDFEDEPRSVPEVIAAYNAGLEQVATLRTADQINFGVMFSPGQPQ